MVNPDFYLYLSLRLDGRHAGQAMSFVRDKWAELFPNQPFSCLYLEDILTSGYQSEEKLALMMMICSILSIVIACLGLLGLTLFTARLRTKELGIRKVFGASEWHLFRMTCWQYGKWILFAVLIAWPIAYCAMHMWLQKFAYRLTVTWWLYLAAAAIVWVLAQMTVGYQVIKIVRANPVESLRYE